MYVHVYRLFLRKYCLCIYVFMPNFSHKTVNTLFLLYPHKHTQINSNRHLRGSNDVQYQIKINRVIWVSFTLMRKKVSLFQNKSSLCWLMFCISFNCKAQVTYIKVIPLPERKSIKLWAALQIHKRKVLMYICLPERDIACPINLSGTTCVSFSVLLLSKLIWNSVLNTLRIQPYYEEWKWMHYIRKLVTFNINIRGRNLIPDAIPLKKNLLFI